MQRLSSSSSACCRHLRHTLLPRAPYQPMLLLLLPSVNSFCRRDAQEQWNREQGIASQGAEEGQQQRGADAPFASPGTGTRARGGGE